MQLSENNFLLSLQIFLKYVSWIIALKLVKYETFRLFLVLFDKRFIKKRKNIIFTSSFMYKNPKAAKKFIYAINKKRKKS